MEAVISYETLLYSQNSTQLNNSENCCTDIAINTLNVTSEFVDFHAYYIWSSENSI